MSGDKLASSSELDCILSKTWFLVNLIFEGGAPDITEGRYSTNSSTPSASICANLALSFFSSIEVSATGTNSLDAGLPYINALDASPTSPSESR